jgi:hypothetical protein
MNEEQQRKEFEEWAMDQIPQHIMRQPRRSRRNFATLGNNQPERTMNKIESAYKEMIEDVQMSGEMIAYCMKDKALELERELTAARAEVERLKDHCRTKVKALQNQTAERMKAEQQRDRLAEALRELRNNESMSLGGAAYEIVEQALQSLTTNEQ